MDINIEKIYIQRDIQGKNTHGVMYKGEIDTEQIYTWRDIYIKRMYIQRNIERRNTRKGTIFIEQIYRHKINLRLSINLLEIHYDSLDKLINKYTITYFLFV